MKHRYLITLFLLATIGFYALRCTPARQNQPMAEEHLLVEKYCGNCHMTPDPTMLDRQTWQKYVLPAMAQRLGLEVWGGVVTAINEPGKITHSEWLKIEAYFDSLAPIELKPAITKVIPDNSWAGFQLKKPKADTQIATTTMVAIQPEKTSLFTSDGETGTLRNWDGKLRNIAAVTLPTPAAFMTFGKENETVLTCIGGMMARDNNTGSLLHYKSNAKTISAIAEGINRPIHTSILDANQDGLTDYLVSNFGHDQGGLYLWLQKNNQKFEKKLVIERSGATQTTIGDFDGDGWPDIIALFAHADESIWLFTNNKDNTFTSRRLLQFPAVYGSSSFQLADMDQDGLLDLLYTAGDNSDYSRILKPYHGLYIFKNQGDFKFEQTYFYPINGCTKAIAQDFDLDGDLDIATIAFFADLKEKPYEKFIYFENIKSQEKLTFKLHAPPIANAGRWICMDVQDFDGDGDSDIMLGNFSKGFLNQPASPTSWDIHTPFVILENKVR